MNILLVLLRPDRPNAYYHEHCYTWDKKELILRVLELGANSEGTCQQCGGLLLEDPPIEGPPQQLTLF